MPATILIIDGNSLAVRSFYGWPIAGYQTPQGQHTNALAGFVHAIDGLVRKYRPTYLTVAFDTPGPTFRHEMLEDYKGGRGSKPEEFAGQLDLIVHALTLMNVAHFAIPGMEADDIVATLAAKSARAGLHAAVFSADKDALQLVNDTTIVIQPVKGVSELRHMNDEAIFAKYGVHAHQYGDYAALIGEQADNIKGVAGVGPKTAAKLLAEYGTLEAILQAAPTMTGKAGMSLVDNAELARLNRKVNTLVDDIPMDLRLSQLAVRPWEHHAFEQFCTENALGALHARITNPGE